MSFISGALDKSVFNQGTWAAAVGKDGHPGYAVVRITPNSSRLGIGGAGGGQDPSIKGVFDFEKGTFGFGVEANWTSLGDIGSTLLPGASTGVKGIFEKINAGSNLAGAAEIGSGLASQLIYQKSGHLEIKIPMMIVDWDGNGQPILSSLLLARYCLPSFILNGKNIAEKGIEKIAESLKEAIGKENVDQITKLTDQLKSFGKEGVELAKKVGATIDEATGGIAADAVEVLGDLTKSTIENIGDVSDAYTLRSSPSDVSVEIGQFFVNRKMVITSVNFEFSKEMTRWGPLYVNIDITLKSRRILTSLNDIGLQLPNKNQRFLYAGGGERNSTGL